MTTATAIAGLTREQISMLRRANSVIGSSAGAAGDMTGRLVARDSDFTWTLELPADVVLTDHASPQAASYVCHGDIGRTFCAEWTTILNFLRPGDVLTLVWTGANDNDLTREIEWSRDELRLRVSRMVKRRGDSERTLQPAGCFLCDVSVLPVHYLTRMIRRTGVRS